MDNPLDHRGRVYLRKALCDLKAALNVIGDTETRNELRALIRIVETLAYPEDET